MAKGKRKAEPVEVVIRDDRPPEARKVQQYEVVIQERPAEVIQVASVTYRDDPPPKPREMVYRGFNPPPTPRVPEPDADWLIEATRQLKAIRERCRPLVHKHDVRELDFVFEEIDKLPDVDDE